MDRLAELQSTIESRAADSHDPAQADRLSIVRSRGLVHLDFYGLTWEESFTDLMSVLEDQAVADTVASLELRGPDEGANGTRNWDLTSLANSRATFPRLKHFTLELTKPADHNRTIVAATYDEEGVLAKILAKAPALETLTTPSAPNAQFFQAGSRPLRRLSVDAGYDHQHFVRNLARSSCFPNLESLEFGEHNETYMDDFATLVTPAADYRELFASPAFASVNHFVWRNPVGSQEELTELARLKPDCYFQVVRWSAISLR